MEDPRDWCPGAWSPSGGEELEEHSFFNSQDRVAYATEQPPDWESPVSDDAWVAVPPYQEDSAQVGHALSLFYVLLVQSMTFCLLTLVVLYTSTLRCGAKE